MNYINALFEYGSIVLSAMVLLVFATTIIVEIFPFCDIIKKTKGGN